MNYYLVKTRSYTGHYSYIFDNEKDAIKRYELENERKNFMCWRSVLLFKMDLDIRGMLPILLPTYKFIDNKWIKTKYYKELYGK